ncbi:MAG: hypothetical protein NUV51_05000 [Sulfuricaulis sp.]|nr:hypothetical protein [Sulfuricaulis sp.]
MLTYPLAVHTAIVFDQIAVASIALFIIAAAVAAISIARPAEHRGVFPFLFSLLAVLSLLSLASGTRYALYVTPVVINLVMLAFFAGSLLAGKEPLITTFHRLTIGRDIDPAISAYMRRLTWIWVLLFGIMTLESAALVLFAPLVIWSLFANFLNYVFVAVLLLGEYFYRIVRFRHYPHPSLWQFLHNLVHIDWARIARSS